MSHLSSQFKSITKITPSWLDVFLPIFEKKNNIIRWLYIVGKNISWKEKYVIIFLREQIFNLSSIDFYLFMKDSLNWASKLMNKLLDLLSHFQEELSTDSYRSGQSYQSVCIG